MYKVWHRIWLFLQSPFLAIPEIKNIGLLWAKVRRFCIESTEVLCKEVRCFCTSEMYAHSPQKKFCNNLLHFLHPGWKTIIKPGNFGCRIILHFPPYFTPFWAYFCIGNVPEVCSFVRNAWGKYKGNVKKTAPKPVESHTNPTSYTLSYTQSYTRNCQ